jgi:hypothetical protein
VRRAAARKQKEKLPPRKRYKFVKRDKSILRPVMPVLVRLVLHVAKLYPRPAGKLKPALLFANPVKPRV